MKKFFVFAFVFAFVGLFAVDFTAEKKDLEVQLKTAIAFKQYEVAEKISATLTNMEAREVLQKQNKSLEKFEVMCKASPIILKNFAEKPEIKEEMKKDMEFAVGMQIFKVITDFLANDNPNSQEEAAKINALIDYVMDQPQH